MPIRGFLFGEDDRVVCPNRSRGYCGFALRAAINIDNISTRLTAARPPFEPSPDRLRPGALEGRRSETLDGVRMERQTARKEQSMTKARDTHKDVKKKSEKSLKEKRKEKKDKKSKKDTI